jgi:uncharacterized protein YndB with AHSA1/START domain
MLSPDNQTITVKSIINLDTERVWELWTDPWHIIHWYQASDDWHTARAENDVKKYGQFNFRMESRDGKYGFDLSGEYRKVAKYSVMEYFLADNRKVSLTFSKDKEGTLITETFEPEHTHSLDLQKNGWQSILNNFKKYAESAHRFKKLKFEIQIEKTANEAFRIMLENPTYETWTSVFNPSSHFEGSWSKGSEIRFLGEDKNGKTGGMISWIKDNVNGKSLKIEHQGIIQDGIEIMDGPEVNSWKGSIESYSFRSVDEHTVLTVELDSVKEFESYFLQTWPEALKKLKSVCENQ